MGTTIPVAVLTDDHIDLLVTASMRWLVSSRTAAAFSRFEGHVVLGTATESGRLLRAENTAAVQWLSDRGRTRLIERAPTEPYLYRKVEHLEPVEVIKAAHAAQSHCGASPTWEGSTAQRLLAAIITAATHRVDGYTEAFWSWTRPQRRSGRPVGVSTTWRPEVPGLTWVDPSDLCAHWGEAPLVVITADAADAIPADLPARAGIFLITEDEHPNRVWQALTALDLQALVLFWPTCLPWLVNQLHDPAPEFVEQRTQ